MKIAKKSIIALFLVNKCALPDKKKISFQESLTKYRRIRDTPPSYFNRSSLAKLFYDCVAHVS